MHKSLTEAQHRKALERARALHDDRFVIDHPQPDLEALFQEETGIEKSVSYLWIIWLIIGLAGAAMSLPHTVSTVVSTVNISGALALGYGIAAFIGVELGLIGIALVSALKELEHGEIYAKKKQSSLAGLINAIALRIGFKAPFKLDYLPDSKPATGAYLVSLLFLAALIFNLADALKDVPMLQAYSGEIFFLSKLTAGLLAPGLLLISGHRFAHEIVRSGTKRQRLVAQHKRLLELWEEDRQDSWQASGDHYIQQALAQEWQRRNSEADQAANPYLMSKGAEPEPIPLGSSLELQKS